MCNCTLKLFKDLLAILIIFVGMGILFNCLVIRDARAKKYLDDMLKSIENMLAGAKNTLMPEHHD